MGIEARSRPPLPAPTESSTFQPSGDEGAATDLATDISRRTDRTSYSIPEDGSPVTINTNKKSNKIDKTLSKSGQASQTSLVIEYYEANKGPNVTSRPSVRVKVTPNSARKGRNTEDHIKITETSGARNPSYTRRISLGPKSGREAHFEEDISVSSAAEESGISIGQAPVDIEVIHKDQDSDLSTRSVVRENENLAINPSEVSSMPPDIMVEMEPAPLTPARRRSRSLSKDEAELTSGTLKTPRRSHSRSLSREHITKKVIEKLGKEPRKVSGGKHSSSKSRSRSVSKELVTETVSSPRRKSGKHHRSDDAPSSDPSLLTASQLSDGRSFRSSTSKSSINNPKLLETVEDAIRRLILPELTALKNEQKTQKNREKFERRDDLASGSSVSREELTRKVSKHSSDPNVRSKSKAALSREEVYSDKKKTRRGEAHEYPPSDRSYERGMSEETVIRDDSKLSSKRSKDSHRARDAAAGTLIGGVLTREALKHHDSQSSMEKRERRRKRSKSHSRGNSQSASVAGTDEIFSKHDVPPMPMRSEVTNSDMTRDSILSERTSTPASEGRRAEIRQVARGSAREAMSPSSPLGKSPGRLKGLGTYHDNGSHGDASVHSEESYRDRNRKYGVTGLAAPGSDALAGHGLASPRDNMEDERSFSHGRELSPIQSVASFEERGEIQQKNTVHLAPSAGSLSSIDKSRGKKGTKYSVNSISSTENAPMKSNRPRGVSLEDPAEILAPHEFDDHDSAAYHDPNTDSWYEQEHEKNEYYRAYSGESSGESKIDVKHLTNFTDDSMDAPYLDKVAASQQIRGIGANPEYVHTPLAVESAVASLYEPSALDVRSTNSGRSKLGETYLDSSESGSQHEGSTREVLESGHMVNDSGSPLKNQVTVSEQEVDKQSGKIYSPRPVASSPQQSISRSAEHYEDEEYIPMSASGIPDPNHPIPAIGHFESKSDTSTNPSIIRGPATTHENNIPWTYSQPGTQQSREAIRSENGSARESVQPVAKKMQSAATSEGVGATFAQREHLSQDNLDVQSSRDLQDNPFGMDDEYQQDGVDQYATDQGMYMNGKGVPTPPLQNIEGYGSEPPIAYSPALTPDNRTKGAGLFGDPGMDELMGSNDPFTTPSHVRHMSGNSHGMASPLYDSSTGKGMDRIQSRDIVALMDHLTVRDAQRNARDTEILVTLVRSAAEMRNSFEDMKRFIQDQDDMLVDVGNKQHEKTQKILGGPRPQPVGTPRVPRASSEDMNEDLPAKRRNVFKRALKGLGGRSNNDLAKIEDMLNHLLDEVADLKSGKEPRAPNEYPQTNGITSYENLRDAPQETYEPGPDTGSPGGHSGYFSGPPSRQATRPQATLQRKSENRVSTVMEGDEEEPEEAPLEPHEQEALEFDNTEHLLTPTRNMPRGGSVPVDTPTAVHVPIGTQSNENTPRTEKKKQHHKSSSSSFFPKISRWSKTTASSVADNVRQSTRRERPFSEVSRSGSDLQNYDVVDHYDPRGDDRLGSPTSLRQGRPPSPLIPSQVSEKPTYRAHRDSSDLLHPQPMHGPTARYQNHLESQVQQYSSPISPTSDQFGSNPVLARFSGQGGNRHSGAGNLSPISDAGYSERSQTTPAPPRPPKIRDEGPLVPDKIPLDERKPTFSERSAPAVSFGQSNGASGRLSPHVPQRKPTGPRPIVSSGSYTSDRVAAQPRTRYRGSPDHIESSSEDVTF